MISSKVSRPRISRPRIPRQDRRPHNGHRHDQVSRRRFIETRCLRYTGQRRRRNAVQRHAWSIRRHSQRSGMCCAIRHWSAFDRVRHSSASKNCTPRCRNSPIVSTTFGSSGVLTTRRPRSTDAACSWRGRDSFIPPCQQWILYKLDRSTACSRRLYGAW